MTPSVTNSIEDRGSALFRFVKPKRVRRRGLGAFASDREGATAVEFAFVSIPFFALMFAILETALAFWTNQVLETAVADASRLIYTGQFQQAHVGSSPEEMREAFREEVCSRVVALFDCRGTLQVDVRSFPSFGAVDVPPPVTAEREFDADSFTFTDSRDRDVVVVRAAIEYPVYATLWDASKGNLANGKRLLIATAAFRNEPFGN